jgi:hypothetical protein
MDGFSWSLLLGAAAIALTHTVLGPDHYLPFVALARARRWSVARTATVTAGSAALLSVWVCNCPGTPAQDVQQSLLN